MTVLLSDLPTEILFQILLWAPPVSIPTFQQVCRKFNALSQPVLWRHHCRRQFRYWSPEHDIFTKLSQDAAQIDWKHIFRNRHLTDSAISHDLERILSSQRGRIAKSERIIAHGYDAKDTLLRHLNVSDEADDVLARRYGLDHCTVLGSRLTTEYSYYSSAVLGAVHRTVAIHEWVKLKDGQSVPLERALAAFDRFVLHHQTGDLEEVRAAYILPCRSVASGSLFPSGFRTPQQCCTVDPA